MPANRPTSTTSNSNWTVTGASAHQAVDDVVNDPFGPDLTDYVAAMPGAVSTIVLACGSLATNASSLRVEIYVKRLVDNGGDFSVSLVAKLLRNGTQVGSSLTVTTDGEGTTISGWF